MDPEKSSFSRVKRPHSLTRRRRQIAPRRQNSITLLAVRLLYESLENNWAGSGKAPGLQNPPPDARRRIPEPILAISRVSGLGSFLLVTKLDLELAPDFQYPIDCHETLGKLR